ncbi:MAG: DUF6516 family protein [bacterium]
MNIFTYLHQLKQQIEKINWLLIQKSISIHTDDIANTGFIEGILSFIDYSLLDFSVTISPKGIRYRFQYMDKEKSLIYRWDNVPHHRELKTFPHHIHTPNGIFESKPIDLKDVLQKIEELIAKTF